MKSALAISVLFSLSLGVLAQSRTVSSTEPARPGASPSATPSLNTILADLQRTTQSANMDLSRLRIERWKVDDPAKQQMQQVATSLQKNLTMAVPELISDVQAAPASVSKAFKLYHDLNVVYEYLNSLAEAAGDYGKKEEYAPLAGDVSSLDNVRQDLSGYIEQAANTLEIKAEKPAPTPQQAQATQSPKKIVIDDDNPPDKKTVKKKKKPAASPAPTPTPSQ